MGKENWLRKYRKERGFKQQELAVVAGVSPALIVNVERYCHFPTEDVRQRISKVLGVDSSVIWPGEAAEVSAVGNK